MKDSGQQYFIHYLDSNDSTSSTDSRAQAAFVLAVICDDHPRGQSLAAGAGLLGVCLSHLRHSMASLNVGSPGPLLLIKWLCLCLGKLCQDMPEVHTQCMVSPPECTIELLTPSPCWQQHYWQQHGQLIRREDECCHTSCSSWVCQLPGAQLVPVTHSSLPHVCVSLPTLAAGFWHAHTAS